MNESQQEKKAMGLGTAALLLGPASKLANGRFTAQKISNLLRKEQRVYAPGTRGENAVDSLEEKLDIYFSKPQRLIALDAGTTVACVANAICPDSKHAPVIPDPDSRISSLTVLTNCPRIAETLEHPSVNVDLILLGGQLLKPTSAVTGFLAEQALKTWNLQFDAAVIGTTSLASHASFFAPQEKRRMAGFHCDSISEARTKSAILQRSSIRIVLMDAKKCDKPRSSVFSFAPVSHEHLDLVITDSRIREQRHGPNHLEAIWEAGVAVLPIDPREIESSPEERRQDFYSTNSQSI